jgi:hypothetical protein
MRVTLRVDAAVREAGTEGFTLAASRVVDLAVEPYPGLKIALTPENQWSRIAVVNEVVVSLADDHGVFVHAHALLSNDYVRDALTADGWSLDPG